MNFLAIPPVNQKQEENQYFMDFVNFSKIWWNLISGFTLFSLEKVSFIKIFILALINCHFQVLVDHDYRIHLRIKEEKYCNQVCWFTDGSARSLNYLECTPKIIKFVKDFTNFTISVQNFLIVHLIIHDCIFNQCYDNTITQYASWYFQWFSE